MFLLLLNTFSSRNKPIKSLNLLSAHKKILLQLIEGQDNQALSTRTSDIHSFHVDRRRISDSPSSILLAPWNKDLLPVRSPDTYGTPGDL
jgi:hypothetical protein